MVELGDLHGGAENKRRIFNSLSGKGASLVTAELTYSWGEKAGRVGDHAI
jgi:uncharacterized glyoxalase superfamily protein PhnB